MGSFNNLNDIALTLSANRHFLKVRLREDETSAFLVLEFPVLALSFY